MDASTKQLVDSTRALVESVWENQELLRDHEIQAQLSEVLRKLESGFLRVASPQGLGPACGALPHTGDLRLWEVHDWVKKAILLTLRYRSVRRLGCGCNCHQKMDEEESLVSHGRVHGDAPIYFDKLDVRTDLDSAGVRIVPPGCVREGAFCASGSIIMPGFVNIGAWVGSGTMVDTWATVGSCAQVGANVHLAGGVGIGGVLEPPNARPVIIGDHCFIGSRCIVVEGAVVSERAVLGANVCITASTPIYDVTTSERTEYRGYVPPYAVVAPGTRARQFPGGEVQLQCAYIIAWRSPETDAKVSLNSILRETGLTV